MITKGIIFDMDNTLIQSKIDFIKMRKAVFERLVDYDMISSEINWQDKTPSQIIEEGRKHPDFPQVEPRIWQIVEEIEAEGMQGAILEEGAVDILEILQKQGKRITILTNNSYSASISVLDQLSVRHFFHQIAGRDQMEQLKPSPSGIHFMFRKFPEISKQEWMMVGDSWIDGMAAKQADIGFIAYRSDLSMLSKKNVVPTGHVQHLIELKQWI